MNLRCPVRCFCNSCRGPWKSRRLWLSPVTVYMLRYAGRVRVANSPACAPRGIDSCVARLRRIFRVPGGAHPQAAVVRLVSRDGHHRRRRESPTTA